MDLGGVVGMEDDLGVASSEVGCLFSSCLTSSSVLAGKHGGPVGSSFQKHGRSSEPEDYVWKSLKQARSEGMVEAPTKADPFLPRTDSHFRFSDGEQMLSFSSAPRQDDALMLVSDVTLPYYHQPSASHSYFRNSGLYSRNSDWNMHGVMPRVRGPFTPSQWLELEHQALIFKYIVANVPIPASLLIPIRRSLSAGLTPFSLGSFGSRTFGWGSSYHLGYSGNADPEPGRCHRTDGKKWRCSRDAVVDQKYCERHINRGRHRSRKHVETHTGHAVKAIPVSSPSETGMPSSRVIMSQLQAKSLQANVSGPSTSQFSRFSANKESGNDTAGSESLLTTTSQKPISAQFSISKPYNPFESVVSQSDFGLIHTDSLLNPSSSSSGNANFSSKSKFNDQQPQANPLRCFIDDWPKRHCDHSTVTWNGEDKQSDRTQLSISIPVTSSDFPSSSSLNNELSLSSLKLSREYDPIPTSLQLGVLNEGSQRQANLIPISWETSVAGPLGEVLTNTNNIRKDLSKNISSSSLNLLSDGCDSCRQCETSPTDVIQDTSFDMLAGNTRNSPMEENQKAYGIADSNICDDILGSTFVGPPAIPSL